MPEFVVKHNDKYAIFSASETKFVTDFMAEGEYDLYIHDNYIAPDLPSTPPVDIGFVVMVAMHPAYISKDNAICELKKVGFNDEQISHLISAYGRFSE